MLRLALTTLSTLSFTTLLPAMTGCGGTASQVAEGDTASGARFAGFAGKTLDGQRLDVRARVGKDVLLVSFWATWCEPCKAEMPFLQKFHERYAKDGLSVISVSIDGPDTASDVAPYIRRQGYTFPVVLDDDGAIAQRHNPIGTAPFAILVARDGSVVKKVAGFQPSEAPALEAEVKALLGLALEPTP